MSNSVIFKFKLYVAGEALNSTQAQANLLALCEQYLPDHHEIEIIDVFRDPRRALADGIFLTPTLLKLTPSPCRKIVGTLSQTEPVLQALGLEAFKP